MPTQTNAITVLLVVASAIIPYLLTQTDVVVPPIIKVILGAANLALVAISRFSNPNATPVQVEVTQAVPVRPATAADEPPTPDA